MRLRASASPPPGQLGEADADRETLEASIGDAISELSELSERCAPAAWGVAYAVLRNRDDASDAVGDAYAKVLRAAPALAPREFRAYFLRAVHNAAVDIQRRSSRVESGLVDDRPDLTSYEPPDALLAEEDRAIVAGAFAGLPERWRSALWLIDVEELSTREAGAVLGVSATNAAQLATRGRSRLREQYMQAHVPNHVRPGCSGTVDALGRYAAGTLPPRKRAAVEQHLAGCAECAGRLAELDDLGVKLRRALPPLPPLPIGGRWGGGGGGDGRSRAHALFEAFTAQAGTGPAIMQGAAASPVFERLAAGATAAVLVVGLSTLAVRGGTPPPSAPAADAPPAAAREAALASAGRPATATLGGGTALPSLPGSVLPAASGGGASVDLRNLDRNGVDLRAVDLSGADLSGTDLSGLDLSGVDLSGANLAGAILTGTNLAGAILTGADLTGADLRGADLSRALGVPSLVSPSGLSPSGPSPAGPSLSPAPVAPLASPPLPALPVALPTAVPLPLGPLPSAPLPSAPSLPPPSPSGGVVPGGGNVLGSLTPQLPGAGPSPEAPRSPPLSPPTSVLAPVLGGSGLAPPPLLHGTP